MESKMYQLSFHNNCHGIVVVVVVVVDVVVVFFTEMTRRLKTYKN
jgi:hypothetical protein